MKARIIVDNETSRESQSEEQPQVFDFDFDSELGKYFVKRDIELSKEFDIGPIDDESL